jgi:hypothetical protein
MTTGWNQRGMVYFIGIKQKHMILCIEIVFVLMFGQIMNQNG